MTFITLGKYISLSIIIIIIIYYHLQPLHLPWCKNVVVVQSSSVLLVFVLQVLHLSFYSTAFVWSVSYLPKDT